MMTEAKDPVFELPWTQAKLGAAYLHFKIKDERAICACGRLTKRTFDGACYSCHLKRFFALERRPCPPLP